MTTTRRIAAAILAAALSLTACSHTHRAAQVIEHSCTAPAQCQRLAAEYPNDDVILTPTDTPPSPHGYSTCDPINAPELCDPDDNPQDRLSIDPSPIVETHRITEDDPRWNCLTMGNHRCGPRYRMIDDLPNWRNWFDMIRADHRGYDPYHCLVKIANTSIIVCDDGWTETS